MLEGKFHVPVIDRTGLAGPFDFALTWDDTGQSTLAALKKSLLTQLELELELVPSREPIEMLVVENVE